MIERLSDLRELAPPLAELLVREVLGEPLQEGCADEGWAAFYQLRQAAYRRGLRAWKELQPAGKAGNCGRSNLARFEQRQSIDAAAEEELLDELRLAIARLGGE